MALLARSGFNDLRHRCFHPAASGQEISGLALFPLLHLCFCIRSNVISSGLTRRGIGPCARRSRPSSFHPCLGSVHLLRFGCTPHFDRSLIGVLHVVSANQRSDGRPFKKERRLPLLSVQRYHRIRPGGVLKLPLDLEVKRLALQSHEHDGFLAQVSRDHLPKYTDEFAFRWNSRKLKDGKRFTICRQNH